MAEGLRITVWNEFRHEKQNAVVREVYPDGIHEAIAEPLRSRGYAVHTATLDEPEHGLTASVLADTDVLVWWGHMAHHEVAETVADAVAQRVLEGMGLVVLHSGHFSKPFKKLMGTSCDLKWREVGERERIWVLDPSHPIAEGLGEYIELTHEEMYGEHFDIPAPDELVFMSWFQGGEVFRSGCVFHRGRGKVFYFRPGHETFPTYHQKDIQTVIANGVKYVAPVRTAKPVYGNAQPLEPLPKA